MAKAKTKAKTTKPAGKNAAEKVAIKAEAAKRSAPRAKRTEGAVERIMSIMTAFAGPVMRSEITTRTAAWEKAARDSAIAHLLSKKKIKVELIRTGGRGRPGEQFSLAA